MAKLNQQADEEIAPGTVVDGRYKVIRPIGQGGTGLVYEVEHVRTGRRLALKALLDQAGFGRLEQEARAASLMKNGHTARIIDMEPSGSAGPYMVMELLEGQSLRGLLDEAGQLPLEMTVNIAMQVCECLHEAHGLSIIHRDLKPENIFLCASQWPGQYDVKVLDFGVMKVAGDGGAIPKSSLTRTGSTVGTPYYMSLEQLRNSSAVDARADVYSLGVVLYECLSGRKPFQAETIGNLVYALCSGPPTPLPRLRPNLPGDVGEVVMRTLSANRDNRPATMVALAASLLTYASPAFALWVKVDGRQPALAPRPAQSAPQAAGYPPAPQPAFAPAAAPAPAVIPAAPAAFAPPAAVEPAASPAEQVWPPPADGGGRRDTPTEMYVKGVHGPRSNPPEPSNQPASHGDRDTPTRAYEALPRAQMLATMKSPVSLGVSSSGDDPVDIKTLDMDGRGQQAAPTFGAPPPVALSPDPPYPPAPPGTDLGAPAGALMTMPIPKNTVPINVLRVAPGMFAPPAPAPAPEPAPVPVPVGPPKPGWQATLDRALVSVGRTGEGLIRRFRAAPQNTQIIVIIVSVTAILLFLGLVVFLIVG